MTERIKWLNVDTIKEVDEEYWAFIGIESHKIETIEDMENAVNWMAAEIKRLYSIQSMIEMKRIYEIYGEK